MKNSRDKCETYNDVYYRPSSHQQAHIRWNLSVGLGHALQLVLLLDGVAVGAALGGVDELVGQALGDGLDVAEGGLAGAGAQQPDGLVHPAQGRHVHGLATHGAGATDAGRVLAGARVRDGRHQHLQRVLKHKR